jgi:hypothetical protein
MTSDMRVNGSLIWLARGVILVLIVLIVILQTVGFGTIKSVREGDTTIFSSSPLSTVFSIIFGLVVCGMSALFWMTRRFFFRLVSVFLFLMATFLFVNAPTGWNHRVVVTPDSFFHRAGAWYAPRETTVAFDSLKYMAVVEKEPEPRGARRYDLLCVPKQTNEPISIPIYDMMKKALPEILQYAAQHNVFIEENADGWQIPPDLRE